MGLNYGVVLQEELLSAYQKEWLWYITVIPCPLAVYLICTPSALGCTYQENHSCPWYNYNIISIAKSILKIMLLRSRFSPCFPTEITTYMTCMALCHSDVQTHLLHHMRSCYQRHHSLYNVMVLRTPVKCIITTTIIMYCNIIHHSTM